MATAEYVPGVGQFVPGLGQTFVWGPVINTVEIPGIFIILYEQRIPGSEHDGEPLFHVYVDLDGGWKDTNRSWSTLPLAILHGLAYNASKEPNAARWNTEAAARVLGLESQS